MSQAARLAHWVPTYSPAVGDVVSATGASGANNVVATAFSAAAGGGGGGALPATVPPPMDGVAAVGASSAYARGDHVHPSDTSRVAKAGDTMTGPLTVAGNITSSFSATPTQGVFAFGNTGSKYLQYDGSFYRLVGGPIVIQDATASSSPATGALMVTGGVGVGNNIYAAGNVSGNALIANKSDGNNIVYFGASGTQYLQYYAPGAAFALHGARFQIDDTTASSSPTTGALTVAGGIGCSGNIYANALNIDNGVPPQLTFYLSSIKQSYINDNGGSINVYSNAAGTAGMYIAHGASAWTAVSDARLPYKRTARPLSALDKLQNIQLYENEVDGRLELFGKAQEIFEAFPHVVVKGDDDPNFTPTGMFDGKIWGVSYERLGLVALQACKELLAQVKLLEDRIATLEAAK